MNKQIFFNAIVSCSLIFGLAILSGCSNQPNLGEHMLDQGSATAALGKQWRTGNDNVQKGEKLIEQGNEKTKNAQENMHEGEKLIEEGNEMIESAKKDVREGEDKISGGKKLVEEGKQQMEESEEIYKKRFPGAYQRIHKNP